MSEPFKINRILPPHELNARRNRKRVVTQLPAVTQLAEPRDHRPPARRSPNDHVYNHGVNPFTHHV